MDKPGRETKENSVKQDSDTKKCNTLHNNTHQCEPPHSILNCLYRGPSIDYSHSPAFTCSGHSNEPGAESAIINISRPASLSANSLLVKEKKNNSPVVHAASSHQAWKIGANQQLYFETQFQNSHSCQIHAINNLMGMAYLSYNMAIEHYSRKCQRYGETWKYTYDPANGFSDSLIQSLLKSSKK